MEQALQEGRTAAYVEFDNLMDELNEDEREFLKATVWRLGTKIKDKRATNLFRAVCVLTQSSYIDYFVDIEGEYGAIREDSYDAPMCLETPETSLLKKEALGSLSKDAREVISLVLSPSTCVLQEITTDKYNLIRKNRIRAYLHKEGWRHRRIDSVFNELSDFVSRLSPEDAYVTA